MERLAKKLELECMWENSMGSSNKKTLIVAGSALELLIEFDNNIVQSVALSFPDSAEIVNKHAAAAGAILFEDLRLREGQNPLTKSMWNFASNFERLAVLDKLSINPGLNMFEAIAGIYESLCRLYAWELQKTRENPSDAAKGEQHLENLVLCTKSGKPTMNEKGRVGMTLDYWRGKRLVPIRDSTLAAQVAEREQTWSIVISCAPLRGMGVNPVRISDKWIGPSVEKMPLPDELHTGGGLVIDWLEPDSTFLPPPDPTKADPMQPEASLLGPRLPAAAFHATLDPPVHIPDALWQQIQQLGCIVDDDPSLKQLATFDGLVLPSTPADVPEPTEPRTTTCSKKTPFIAPGQTKVSLKYHVNTLRVYKPAFGRTLREFTFSHPQQLITILPYLRQYIFLTKLLQHSFTELRDPSSYLDESNDAKTPAATSAASTTAKSTITTNLDDYHAFMSDNPPRAAEGEEEEVPLKIDITLTMTPVPRLRVVFPFCVGRTAHVTLEIQENGHVHVEAQDVLSKGNMVAQNGRQRKVEDIGGLLEMYEDLGKWAEFMRSRWA